MARVITIAQSVRDLTGGLDRFEIDAPTVRALVAALDARYPGVGALVRETMFIAIDGELHHQAWEEPLAPDTEVVLVPMIAGG
jgi:molybdopterin converting factor small subunit